MLSAGIIGWATWASDRVSGLEKIYSKPLRGMWLSGKNLAFLKVYLLSPDDSGKLTIRMETMRSCSDVDNCHL